MSLEKVGSIFAFTFYWRRIYFTQVWAQAFFLLYWNFELFKSIQIIASCFPLFLFS